MDHVNEQCKIALESLKKMRELSRDKILIDSVVIEDNCKQVNETIEQKMKSVMLWRKRLKKLRMKLNSTERR